MDATQALELLDWKRRIFELYAEIRSGSDPEASWERWRRERDRLFGEHPQSPLGDAAKRSFSGLPFYDYDPAARVEGHLEPAEPERYEIGTSGDEPFVFERIGTVSFEIAGAGVVLELYWLEGYGGGLFLPFRDATAGNETYGAGRYLLDTIKGADLGTSDGRLVLDFNFAYHPSCAYDPRWVCPLAPLPNRIDVPIRAGERLA